MKTAAVVIMLVGMLSGFYTAAEGADWVLYVEIGDGSKEYYDKATITRPSKDSVKVATKLMLSDKQKQRVIEAGAKDGLPAKDLEKLSYLQSVYVINCVRKQFQVLSIAHYDVDGKLVRSDDRPEDMQLEWDQIPPNTVVDHLQNAVCPKKSKK
jgi:hypothetical protein